MRTLKYLATLLMYIVCVVSSHSAFAQLPSEGVIFDDFEYTSTTWCSEVNGTCSGGYPPAGSVFGRNVWHTSVSRATTNSRSWYRYLWQEQNNEDTGTSLNVTTGNNGHLTFRASAGTYSGHQAGNTIPRQIISGFTARRGTWAARVNFGDMEPANVADFVQAFWTWSLTHGRASDGTDRWNEFDFEWNNRFNGTSQQYHYLRTGHTAGDISNANASASHVPLFSPAWPDGDSGSPINFDWSCKFVWGNFEDVAKLGGEDCSKVVNQETVRGHTPLYDPGMVLFLQITNTSVFYAIVSDGWGGVLVANSNTSSRIPNLPMATLVSQHIQSASTVNTTEDYSVDWVYYSPSTTIDINNVNQHVAYLRNTVNTPRFNNTGLTLERPYAHLAGVASTYGLAHRTTSLSLDFSLNPTIMNPGSQTPLVALPPLRHGFYRYTWRYRKIYSSGSRSSWYSLASRYGGWEALFTFPTGFSVSAVEIEVKLEELISPSNPVVINNSTVYPITRYFTIFNAAASKQHQNASEALPDDFSLEQNYPNPFNPQTEIRFALPEETPVTLLVSDLLGREVARLIDGTVMSAGFHQVTWDASKLPSAVYMYQIRTPKFIKSKTMVLMK